MSTPVTVTCPECGAKLKLKSRESLGRKRPCPKCEVPFVLTEGSKGSQQVRKGSFAENNRPLLIGLAAGGLVAVGMLVASLVLPRGGDPAPQPGETVADQNDSTPGTSPPTGETPRRTDSANARQNGFDLLAMANVSRDAQGGEWTRNGAAIVSRGGTAILQLPIEPAGDYRADVTFTRESDDQQVNLILAVPGTDRKFLLVLDWKGGGHHGIETVNGAGPGSGNPTHNNSVAMRPAGQANRASVEVRSAGQSVSVKAELNGQELFDWKGQPRQLDSPYWQTKNPRALGLGSGSGGGNRFVVRYDEYRLTPLSDWGGATPTGAVVAAASSPTSTSNPGTNPSTPAVASTDPPVRPSTDQPARSTPRTTNGENEPGLGPTSTGPVAISIEPDSQTFNDVVRPFLQQHCQRCHGPQTQESDFRVDEHLPNDFGSHSIVERWSEVLNMLNSGDMPPEGEPRPPAATVARVAEWIEHERLRAERSRLDTGVVLRRMNREEYNNTIRDLFGIDLRPADEFPEDPPAGGFDNNGGALSISPLHVEMYLQAAAKVLARAIVTGQQRPTPRKWRFETENAPNGRYERFERDGIAVTVTRRSQHIENGMIRQRRGGYEGDGYILSLGGIPQTGDYAVRVRAASSVPSPAETRRAGAQVWRNRLQETLAKITDPQRRQNKQAEYDGYFLPESKKHFDSDPAYAYGPPRMQIRGRIDGRQETLAELDVDAPLSSPRVYETRKRIRGGVAAQFSINNVYRIPNHQWNWSTQARDDFPRPALYLDWVEVEGPLVDEWPPASHKRIFIDSPNRGRNETVYARDILTAFMKRAFRRPLADGEEEPYLAIFSAVRPEKSSFEEAMKTPLTAVLASPHFLHLVEPNADDEKALTDYELASRLSYFLWSTMPDDELFQLATQGRLKDPQVLVAQVDRMLGDPKAIALAQNFAGQWLDLREIGANPPVPDLFPRYDRHLELSMRRESEEFFRHILTNDRLVTDFLKSSYVVINERMARFYGISGVKGDRFRAVDVPTGNPRGGLVTQASVLAVTSNGTRTSPVWRGVWILEKLLGDPPGSPPPDAGDIPPATADLSKATVRQRLQAHRNHVQCARCHRKIDPLGFALENFDASGFWRDKEPSGMYGKGREKDPPIDATATMPDGTRVNGVTGLQTELLKHKTAFTRNLTQMMTTYALGRELGFADDEWIDAVSGSANAGTLRGMIREIVSSERFLSK